MLVASECSVSGRFLSRKIVASGAVSLSRTGRRASSQGPRKTGIDRHQGLSHLATHDSQCGLVGRSPPGHSPPGAGSRRLAWLNRGRTRASGQGGSVGFQGITEHRQFACGGSGQALVRGSQPGRHRPVAGRGWRGVSRRLVVGTLLECTPQRGIDPAAVILHRPPRCREPGRC